jgi:hypothetical protein
LVTVFGLNNGSFPEFIPRVLSWTHFIFWIILKVGYIMTLLLILWFCYVYYIVLLQSAFGPYSLWHRCGFCLIVFIFYLCNHYVRVYQNSNQLYAILT